jgi:hypothetical protein
VIRGDFSGRHGNMFSINLHITISKTTAKRGYECYNLSDDPSQHFPPSQHKNLTKNSKYQTKADTVHGDLPRGNFTRIHILSWNMPQPRHTNRKQALLTPQNQQYPSPGSRITYFSALSPQILDPMIKNKTESSEEKGIEDPHACTVHKSHTLEIWSRL